MNDLIIQQERTLEEMKLGYIGYCTYKGKKTYILGKAYTKKNSKLYLSTGEFAEAISLDEVTDIVAFKEFEGCFE